MTEKHPPISTAGAVSGGLRCRRAIATRFCALVVVALLLGSCATGTRDARPDTKAVTPAPGPQVKLLQAGAKPRKKLRLHPKPGDKQTVDMTLKITMDIQAGEMPSQPMKMPPMKMTTEVTVKSVSHDGSITYEMVMTDASVADDPDAMPQVVEAMKSSLTGLKGLSGTGVMSNRGLNNGIEMKVPPGADPQLRQALEQAKDAISRMAAPLPEEAVGPGAIWEFKEPIKSQGMTMDQTVTYQLLSRQGERLATKSTIVQSASNQKIQNPAMAGLQLDLTKMAGNGQGNLTFELGKILPLKATGDVHSELSMQMDMSGQTTTMLMKMDMNVGLEAK
jgi:hypothetical protein